MSKNEIKITVAGHAGTGKSTIQMVIIKALLEKGFEVEMRSLDYLNELAALRNGEELIERNLPELVDKVKVTVEEQQLRRAFGKELLA